MLISDDEFLLPARIDADTDESYQEGEKCLKSDAYFYEGNEWNNNSL